MKLPVTLGHENVGEVVAAGSGAQDVKIGARMLAHPWIGCGACAVCQRGEENLCRAMKSLGVFSNGGYSDYVMLPHPRYLIDIGDLAAGARCPARLLGRHHLRRPEEGRPDAEDRSDRDHRRRRAWA